jgi:DNA-binding XRE family transcriptional regulator
MLSLSLIDEIDRLLSEGKLSQRKIAIRLGVSRGTVNAIARGQRSLYGREPEDDANDDNQLCISTTPPRRCPSCGYRVYAPCRICRTREHQQRRSA